jgi:glycosyltransferase involved in cell wall biosynthesis
MVLPSVGETWSVAVLESLASSLPVVTTDTVGPAADAINDPAVGSIVPTGDVDALAEAIGKRLAAGTNRSLVRARWSPMRERFSYEAIGRDLLSAVRRAVAEQKAGRVG